MTTTTDPGAGYAPTPSPSTPSCDPDQFARLKCVAKGIEARAKYNQDNENTLTTARTRYDAARGLYTKARDDAAPLLAQARKDLDKVFERLDCLMDADAKQKLEAAADEVGQQLQATGWGCYLATDCDFDDDVKNCPPTDVPSRIADIQRRTKEAEDFFAVRIEEPMKIGERVTNLQAEIADLTTKVNNDPAPADLPKLYAAALVANLHYDMVWDGFDSVDDYMDCLCTALNCIFGGHNAISRLTQKQAVAACWAERKAETEKKLEDDPAQAVLDRYTHPPEQDGQYGSPPQDPGTPPSPGYQPQPPAPGYGTPPSQGYPPPPPQDGYDGEPTDDSGYDDDDDDAGYGEPAGPCEPSPEPAGYQQPQSRGYGQQQTGGSYGQGQPQGGGYGQGQPQGGGYGQGEPPTTPAQPGAPGVQARTASRTTRRTPPRQGGATAAVVPPPAKRAAPATARRRTQNPPSGQ